MVVLTAILRHLFNLVVWPIPFFICLIDSWKDFYKL